MVARGTPGMSGADLANLVNEAALHAVRRGAPAIAMADFEAARDRVLMGQRRESTVLSDKEKEATAYHEGGHAVLAYVLPDADPVHKVTILPTGMALGVTQQLPIEERHTYWREYIEDAVCVMMGGRCAESLILGSLSTGASNDLQRATEMARKMVREFGMSERIGPMAWGQEGQVFLGEDLMHAARDYSDVTSRVIDEEVERILREQEARASRLLGEHRHGLAAVAAALLEHETIDGAEVGRLVDEAYGRPVHEHVQVVPRFAEDDADGPGRPQPGQPSHPARYSSPRTRPASGPQGLSGTPKLRPIPGCAVAAVEVRLDVDRCRGGDHQRLVEDRAQQIEVDRGPPPGRHDDRTQRRSACPPLRPYEDRLDRHSSPGCTAPPSRRGRGRPGRPEAASGLRRTGRPAARRALTTATARPAATVRSATTGTPLTLCRRPSGRRRAGCGPPGWTPRSSTWSGPTDRSNGSATPWSRSTDSFTWAVPVPGL